MSRNEAKAPRRYAVEVVVELSPDGEMLFVASHPDLPGCMAQGETPEEAISELDEARELYISALQRRGLPVPEPQSDEEEPVEPATFEVSVHYSPPTRPTATVTPNAIVGQATGEAEPETGDPREVVYGPESIRDLCAA